MTKTHLSFLTIKNKHIVEPYDKIAKIYTQKHFGEKIFIPLLTKFVKLLPQDSLVLDVGCGPGGETQFLLKKGLEVLGVDISPKMIEIARELVPEGNFQLIDITSHQLADNQFAGIWCARTLIHIPSEHLDKLLRDFHRILQKDGVLCATVLIGDCEGVEPECYDPTNSTTTFFKYFKQGELEELMKKNGFEIIDIQKTHLGKDREEHDTVYGKKN